jgi:hypothetical protein
LVVYDPFYCAGQMVNYLHELGVMNVINRNRDFYADVAAGDVPSKFWVYFIPRHIVVIFH